ncbi:MAG TPA: CcmD family protein [Longimicrobiales bacterium]
MSEWGYVIAAYALTWVVVGGYVLYLRGRTARAREELDAAAAREAEP